MTLHLGHLSPTWLKKCWGVVICSTADKLHPEGVPRVMAGIDCHELRLPVGRGEPARSTITTSNEWCTAVASRPQATAATQAPIHLEGRVRVRQCGGDPGEA
jgi:hypothetical protein